MWSVITESEFKDFGDGDDSELMIPWVDGRLEGIKFSIVLSKIIHSKNHPCGYYV